MAYTSAVTRGQVLAGLVGGHSLERPKFSCLALPSASSSSRAPSLQYFCRSLLHQPVLSVRQSSSHSARCRVSTSASKNANTVATSIQEGPVVVEEVGEEAGGRGGGQKGGKGRGKRGKASKGQDSSGASSIVAGCRLENISKSFKNMDVLTDVSWEVGKGERVGLVGYNGAGKTTQLQIITGELEADGGNVILPKRCQVAYLTQEFEVVESRTVREEFLQVYAEQIQLQKDLEAAEKELGECLEDMDRMQTILERIDKLQTKADNVDMYAVDKDIDLMMEGLGFKPEDNDRLVASFSGGWKMRMSLGKILLQKPDLLLLDEPTNHLDLDSVEWLEQYLKEQEVPMVVVSHDRAFLDQLCTKIVETERGVATTWKGNYSDYVNAKAAAVTAAMVAWERQQKELARQTEMINRLSGGGQAGRAESAKKAMEKMKAEGEMLEKPFIAKKRQFRFPQTEKSGRIVCRSEGLTHGYGGKTLFADAELLIEAGERVAFVGPNGCGKSTFLRLLQGAEKPDAGYVELGDHNIIVNYFEQNQAEALDMNMSLIDTLERAAPDKNPNELKALLGRFMFQGDQIHKKVSFLSGGEKARVALAKFLVTPATLLVLDEPTNHLDIQSKEMLEEALKNFQGSVIAVSHDRYFLKQIATRVVDIKNSRFENYDGDYQYFLESNEDAAAKEERFAAKELEIQKSQVKAKSKLSKAEKMKLKKEKAKNFANGKGKTKKNAKRWN